MPKKIFSIRIEPELEQGLKRIAETERRTVSWIAEDMLRRAVERHAKSQKKEKAA